LKTSNEITEACVDFASNARWSWMVHGSERQSIRSKFQQLVVKMKQLKWSQKFACGKVYSQIEL